MLYSRGVVRGVSAVRGSGRACVVAGQLFAPYHALTVKSLIALPNIVGNTAARKLSTFAKRLISTAGHDDHHVAPPFYRHPIQWWWANSAQVKILFKRYGYFAVATYLGVYVLTLFGLYGVVKLGLITGPDVNAFINNWSVKKFFTDKDIEIPDGIRDFMTAWVMTKMTEPVRLVATIALVPFLVRRLPQSFLAIFKIPPHTPKATKVAKEALKSSAPPAAPPNAAPGNKTPLV